jgi:hypothetical protein
MDFLRNFGEKDLKSYFPALLGGLIGWFIAHRILEGSFPLGIERLLLFSSIFSIAWASLWFLSKRLNEK